MRTWRQGRIGKITFLDSSSLYVKCLKYPLAQFYFKYENRTGLFEEFLFEAKLQKSVLRYIETLGQHELSKKEKENEGTSSKIYEILELQEIASLYMKERG
jgi:hypothetical protein